MSNFWNNGLSYTYFLTRTTTSSITSNTTLASDSVMTFTADQNAKYVLDGLIYVGAALATTGIKLTLTATSGSITSLQQEAGAIVDTISTSGTYFLQNATAGTALDFTTTTMTSAGSGLIRYQGYLVVGASNPVLALQFAQSSSSATALVIGLGSNLKVARIA